MKALKKPMKKKLTQVPRRSCCPKCGYAELLTEGVDQFCLACDWDTCAEYVERGLMDNIAIAGMVHFPPSDDHVVVAEHEEVNKQNESLKAIA